MQTQRVTHVMATLMKIGRWMLWLAALLLLSGMLLAVSVTAQHHCRTQGAAHSTEGLAAHRYDPQTVADLDGVISRIDRVPMGDHTGRHLTLEGDTTEVHLGPEWFLKRQNLVLQVGDAIYITGSRVTAMGRPVLIAAEIIRGDETLVLRDVTGRPLWRGWCNH